MSDNVLKLHPKSNPCKHSNIVVDREAEHVTCRECGEKLSAVAILYRMITTESTWRSERERIIDARAQLEQRSRTKCEHCLKMTKIKTKRNLKKVTL